MEKYNKQELNKISHSLGIQFFESVMSHKKKDKELPDEFYRNHYSINKCDILDGLVDKSFASKRQVSGSNCYNITDLGIKKFRAEFNELVNYKPKKDRDLNYLKKRINFYCDFYNYRFGSDNSEHIISSYVNYFLKGFYMSHTTTDCINQFKSELSSLRDVLTPEYEVSSN
ncbi:hypothetical protein [Tenacibaculum finnmarkense]|uniref:hypothetical protein n=1 Tax=Tenacibaculum finnmarkense TaxID=2781243 RepID=UPI001E3784B3|nr:hypothetical protein [Tenacibaculum finnmarkense]MCD8448033.1 hypothetical protein [Tenacibaculum finnmarkense genomovar finnmarkense]